MKRNFFKIVLGSLALMLGFSTCKKDCEDCFSYTDGGFKYTYCESDFASKDAYESYKIQIQSAGYIIETFEECD